MYVCVPSRSLRMSSWTTTITFLLPSTTTTTLSWWFAMHGTSPEGKDGTYMQHTFLRAYCFSQSHQLLLQVCEHILPQSFGHSHWRQTDCRGDQGVNITHSTHIVERLRNYAELSTIMFVHRMTLEWKQMTKKRCWKIWQIRYHIHTWYFSYIEYAACAKHKRSLSCKKILL